LGEVAVGGPVRLIGGSSMSMIRHRTLQRSAASAGRCRRGDLQLLAARSFCGSNPFVEDATTAVTEHVVAVSCARMRTERRGE
jgi:hypothetical protein